MANEGSILQIYLNRATRVANVRRSTIDDLSHLVMPNGKVGRALCHVGTLVGVASVAPRPASAFSAGRVRYSAESFLKFSENVKVSPKEIDLTLILTIIRMDCVSGRRFGAVLGEDQRYIKFDN
jgi:hypothetical protein